jgi:hypothetical protein
MMIGQKRVSASLGDRTPLSGEGASVQKITFADLRLSRRFGPEQDGDGARALMLVLQKGCAHEDRFTTAKLATQGV